MSVVFGILHKPTISQIETEEPNQTENNKQKEVKEARLMFYDLESSELVKHKEMSLIGLLGSSQPSSEALQSQASKPSVNLTDLEMKQHFNLAISQDGRYFGIGVKNNVKIYDITTKQELSPLDTDLLGNGF